MKKLAFLFGLILYVSASAVFAQNTEYSSSRLTNLASTLKRQTVDLSDRVYSDFRGRYSNSRSDVNAVFLAQQMDASAYIFQEMVRDNRRASELRDAAAALNDMSRRAPYNSNYLWRDVQRSIDDIQRELGNSGGNDWDDAKGRVTWRGMVDNIVQIDVLGGALGVRTISGTPYPVGVYNFSSPLPRNNVKVYVRKIKGRGSVKVISQPSAFNNWGAVIEVRDTDGGAKEYELEIYWK